MTRISSQISPSSEEFRANAAAMGALVADLAEKRAAAAARAEKLKARHVARGKLLARDRVLQLIDPRIALPQLSQLAAFGLYSGDIHGAGLLTGIDPRQRTRA